MDKRYQIDFEYCTGYARDDYGKGACVLHAKNEAEAKAKCIKLYKLKSLKGYGILKVREV